MISRPTVFHFIGTALRWALGSLLLAAPVAHAQGAPADSVPEAGQPSVERRTIGSIERALVEQGLENVTVAPGKGLQIAYENRRYRHSATALGVARAAAGEPVLVGERRLGLMAAALQPLELGSKDEFKVLYPSDSWFPAAPQGAHQSPTFRRMDLDLGLRVDYRFGQVFDPFQARVELEPRIRLNPWPGAHLRAGVIVPLQSDFQASADEPDIGRVRPGRMSLDQFLWFPVLGLGSFSGGYFGEYRWGFSVGGAKPLRQGEWLLDAQLDRTGFLAFPEGGAVYSPLSRWSAFAGVTYRPPFADVALRVRGGQFLFGDRGVEFEVERTLGDVSVGYFVQRVAVQDEPERDVFGVRLDLPVPPLTRATGSAIRIQPAPRFRFDFHDEAAPVGRFLEGVASREDFLRQLNKPALEANGDRFRRAAGGSVPPRPASAMEWVSFSGMTGFIQTPWAGVLADRRLDVGFDFMPRKWAYDRRGINDNQIFYGTFGFLPRVETSIRWTRIPGYHSFEDVVPDSRLVDIDRMVSGRLLLLEPANLRPGLAIGVEDPIGFRRFHSTYAVAGLPMKLGTLPARASIGYGFKVFEDVVRRTLDGGFGAAELSATPWARIQVEYDSEKWNAGLGLAPGAGFQVRTALLNLDTFTLGASWSHPL